MQSRRATRTHDSDPFTDLLFNALLGFVFMFLIAIMLLNPPAKTGIIDPKAEFIINVSWEDMREDDADTWVEAPTGEILWFRNTEVGLMHLDRDDRGSATDMITFDGASHINPLNQEIVTIRGYVPGEYVVNVHYYNSVTQQPLPVTVKVSKVNPRLEVVYYGTVTLPRTGNERTAVRFTVDEQGIVSNVNTLQKEIVLHEMLN